MEEEEGEGEEKEEEEEGEPLPLDTGLSVRAALTTDGAAIGGGVD
jgi:hypothetical protein